MQKKYGIFLLLLILLISSCNTYQEVEILRFGRLEANINGENWSTNRFETTGYNTVVVYVSDQDDSGTVFTRFTIDAIGTQPDGRDRQLSFTLDFTNISELRNRYTEDYNEDGGLHQISLYDEQSDGRIKIYQLCNPSSENDFFEIRRQSAEERLISGDFNVTLCNPLDPTDQITLSAGDFRDLRYSR